MNEKKNVSFRVKNCAGCGLCYSQYPDFFTEKEDGKAKSSKSIYKIDSEEIKEISSLCPCNAINVIEEKNFTKQDYINELEKLKNHVIPYPNRTTFKFDPNEYSISIPYARGEGRYEYSSDRTAQRAAEKEFNDRMYSQIDLIILKIITEYRMKYVKPYYTKSKEEGSFYVQYNEKISENLNNLLCILKSNSLCEDIPSEFTTVDVFPANNESHSTWKMLNNGELLADEMINTIRNEFNSSNYRNSTDSYSHLWDTDYTERPDGTDWRGRTKWKDKYCYKNVCKAFEELAKDILFVFGLKYDTLEERAVEVTRWVIDDYKKALEDHLSHKITYLESKLNKFDN